MPKFKVEYGLDVPAYGEAILDIDPEDRDGLIKQVRALHEEDKLINGWDISPDSGCDNYRVVHIFKQREDDHNWEQLDWDLVRCAAKGPGSQISFSPG